jgi:alpha-beta hydrolase superfamily lysophospholipase
MTIFGLPDTGAAVHQEPGGRPVFGFSTGGALQLLITRRTAMARIDWRCLSVLAKGVMKRVDKSLIWPKRRVRFSGHPRPDIR